MDPQDIISEEESQALRAEDCAPGGPQPAGRVQDLHADHWERILADRAPALDSIADRMVSLLKVTARKYFRASPDVVAHPLRSIRWGAYARALPAPVSLSVIDIKPAGLKGVVAINPDFIFTLVDVFFGGDGRGTRPEEMIEFTAIEQRLARKFVETVLNDLRQAWKPFLELDLALAKTESSPIFAGVASSSEPVSVARFGFLFGEHEHAFDIVLPAAVVESLRALGDPARRQNPANDAEKWRNRLRHDVESARVSMRAILTASEISLRDIAMARPGDVIYTDLPGSVVLVAGDKPLLEGTLGVSQGRNAVRISKPVNREALGEQHGRTKSH
jgi:flagellar motor switch protein FliM